MPPKDPLDASASNDKPSIIPTTEGQTTNVSPDHSSEVFGQSVPRATDQAAPVGPPSIPNDVMSSPPVQSTEPPQVVTAQPAAVQPAAWTEPSEASLASIQTVDETTTGGPAPVPVASMSSGKRLGGRNKKRLLFGATALALLLVLGGGYAFAVYLPNQPGNIYKSGMSRTAKAYDKLVEYTKTVDDKDLKGSKLDGTFKLTSSTISADGTFSGSSGDKNADGTLKANIAGQKVTINARSVTADAQTTPDVYFQVSGVKSYLSSFGLDSLAGLDGQWIAADHTLLETYAAQAEADKQQPSVSPPTSAQVQDALKTIGEVNNKYLFKADADHAVLKQEKYLGKSTHDGRVVYGYDMGYDKAHLKEYVKALQSGLNETSLNDWAQKATGKSINQADVSSLIKSIDKAKADYKFTLYINAKTKLVDTLHFKDSESSDYFEISQSYDGGSIYPFGLKYVSNSDPDQAGMATLSLKLDSETNKISFAMDVDAKDNGSPITFKLTAEAQGSNDVLKITAPANAKPVMEVYNSLGFGNYGSDLESSYLESYDQYTNDDLFTLTQ